MRNDLVIPKAVIQRWRDRNGADVFVLVKWDLGPAQRTIMGVYSSLDKANELVLFDVPSALKHPIPRGREAFGAYSREHRS